MPLRWSLSFGPRSASLLFAGIGVLLLTLGVHDGRDRRNRLEHWPSVEARVDSATVVNMVSHGAPRDLYAARLWVSYDANGWPEHRGVTEEVYSNNYGAAVHTGRQALAAGHVSLLVAPGDFGEISFEAGYNWKYFFDTLVLSALGIFFCAFGVLFLAISRNEARKAARKARGEKEPARKSLPSWAVVTILFALGAMFVIGGGWGVSMVHGQRAWPSLSARVDSTDVVWDAQGTGSNRATMYAARFWVTYALRDSTFHAPVLPGAWFSSRRIAERRGIAGRASGRVAVDVDPQDPYRVVPHASTVLGAYWLPMLFVVIGLLVWGIPLLVYALGPRRRFARETSRPRRVRPWPMHAPHQEHT